MRSLEFSGLVEAQLVDPPGWSTDATSSKSEYPYLSDGSGSRAGTVNGVRLRLAAIVKDQATGLRAGAVVQVGTVDGDRLTFIPERAAYGPSRDLWTAAGVPTSDASLKVVKRWLGDALNTDAETISMTSEPIWEGDVCLLPRINVPVVGECLVPTAVAPAALDEEGRLRPEHVERHRRIAERLLAEKRYRAAWKIGFADITPQMQRLGLRPASANTNGDSTTGKSVCDAYAASSFGPCEPADFTETMFVPWGASVGTHLKQLGTRKLVPLVLDEPPSSEHDAVSVQEQVVMKVPDGVEKARQTRTGGGFQPSLTWQANLLSSSEPRLSGRAKQGSSGRVVEFTSTRHDPILTPELGRLMEDATRESYGVVMRLLTADEDGRKKPWPTPDLLELTSDDPRTARLARTIAAGVAGFAERCRALGVEFSEDQQREMAKDILDRQKVSVGEGRGSNADRLLEVLNSSLQDVARWWRRDALPSIEESGALNPGAIRKDGSRFLGHYEDEGNQRIVYILPEKLKKLLDEHGERDLNVPAALQELHSRGQARKEGDGYTCRVAVVDPLTGDRTRLPRRYAITVGQAPDRDDEPVIDHPAARAAAGA